MVVVGGGKAGLTAGYYLSRAAIPYLILDSSTRIGESWGRRWDSLELFTSARYSSLRGWPFPGDPKRFPGKDEVADYIESYALKFELLVRLSSPVTSLERSNCAYRVDSGSGSYETNQVIVATGAYQRPYVPPSAEKLGDEVIQLHAPNTATPSRSRLETC